MRWPTIVLSMLPLVMGTPAHSEITVDELLAWRSDPADMKVTDSYLSGIIAGFLWYGVGVKKSGEKELFLHAAQNGISTGTSCGHTQTLSA